MYNLVKRQAEVEILPLAQAEQIGVIPYSPLGGGLLTGKYSGDSSRSGTAAENQMYRRATAKPSTTRSPPSSRSTPSRRAIAPATLAVAWVMSHPAVTSAIIGARNVAQLEDSLEALDVAMTPAWRAEISALSYEPPPATDRLEEQRH